MEPPAKKARSLPSSPKPSTSSSPKWSSPHPKSRPVKFVSLEELKSNNETLLMKSLCRLKKQTSTKLLVRQFMDPKGNQGKYDAIVDVFIRKVKSLNKDEKNSYEYDALKNTISVLANCCNFSTTACLKLKENRVRFPALAVQLYDCDLPTDCKYSLTRLVANMCAHKEAALCITSTPALIDQICKLLESGDGQLASQAFRVCKTLVNGGSNSFTKAVLLSNGAFFLSKLIVDTNSAVAKPGELMQLLYKMGQKYAIDVGMQFSSGGAVDIVLEKFFEGDSDAQQLLIRLSEGSLDVRMKIEQIAIAKIIEETDCCPENLSSEYSSLLSSFAQDAFGRESLRVSGALDLLIAHFATSSSSTERCSIATALKHFIHDTTSMAHMARCRSFVDVVVRDVSNYATKYGAKCEPIIQEDDDVFLPDSPLLVEIETNLNRRKSETERSEDQPLSKDFYALWSYASPSRGYSHASSPMFSFPSSGAASPVYGNPSSPTTSVQSRREFHDLTASSADDEDSRLDTSIADGDKTELHITETELWLVGWQAFEDSNLKFLVREDLVDAVLNYIALVPRANIKCGKVLQRMASCRSCLDILLGMQFHTRVLTSLCGLPCRIERYAKRCNRCERLANFGRELLREFASHVDSDFGYSFLAKQRDSEDFVERATVAIAEVALIRNRFRLRRLSSSISTALEVIFSSLKHIMTQPNIEEYIWKSSYSNGPPICVQLIGAISSLISQDRIRDIFEVQSAFIAPTFKACKVKVLTSDDDRTNFLQFKYEGRLLAAIKLEDACKNSGYFQGMFSADLSEKTSNLRRFEFDPELEHCSDEDFTRFLHFLAGCNDSCNRIANAETCLALIQLTDRYLCTNLAEMLCAPHGPINRFVTGKSLPLLLPAALATNIMHPRFLSSCFSCLVRYATSKDVVATLLGLLASEFLIETFLSQFRAFVDG